jgi:hypothetical protein
MPIPADIKEQVSKTIVSRGSIKIERECECLKSSPVHYKLKKGKRYMVKCIYQDIDGSFMAEIINGYGETSLCYASRFRILPIL